MARQTRKYVRACERLAIPPYKDLPHEAVYGLLAVRGYAWDGEHWLPSASQSDKHLANGSLRVKAAMPDAEIITLSLIDMLAAMGITAHRLTGPTTQPDSQQSFFTIYFTYNP